MLYERSQEMSVPTSAACSIDEKRILEILAGQTAEDRVRVNEVLAKALEMKGLSFDEISALMNITSPELEEQLFHTAKEVKESIYG